MSRNWPGHRLAVAFFVTVLAAWLVAMAVVVRQSALPPEAAGTMLAIFEPHMPEDEIFARLTRAEARIIRSSGLGFIWVVTSDNEGLAGRLEREGALGAYRDLPISPAIAGCFAFADAQVAYLLN
jgi:hypothetical protein